MKNRKGRLGIAGNILIGAGMVFSLAGGAALAAGCDSSGGTDQLEETLTVSINGDAEDLQTLTANVGGTAVGDIAYQWNNVAGPNTTNAAYNVVAADIGNTITVTVTRDGKTATSDATATVVAEQNRVLASVGTLPIYGLKSMHQNAANAIQGVMTGALDSGQQAILDALQSNGWKIVIHNGTGVGEASMSAKELKIYFNSINPGNETSLKAYVFDGGQNTVAMAPKSHNHLRGADMLAAVSKSQLAISNARMRGMTRQRCV